MRIRFHSLAFVATALISSTTFGGKSPSDPLPSTGASDTVKTFLAHVEQGQVTDAIKLWDRNSLNDKLQGRIVKMAAKVKGFGGIEKIDVGTVESRRVKAFEKQTGEKIDVVPVEIGCRDRNLLLAVFSVRKKDGQYMIFRLESLKEWGGTASLDDELPYMH